MKIKVKLPHETRTIEHVERLEIGPDNGHEEDRILNVDNELADDGGLLVIVTEEEA